MLPTYKPSQILLGWRWFKPKVGQVVVAQTDRPIIKRIAKIFQGSYWLEGDNTAASTNAIVQRDKIEALIQRSHK